MNSSLLAYIGMPGPMELIIIAGVVLLLFGKRLPGAMRSLGQSVVEFKKGINQPEDEPESEPATKDSES